MPTGTSTGLNKVRAAISVMTTNPAPKTAEQGMSTLKSEPTNKRVTCGTIRPTNPKRPATLTADAANKAATITSNVRVCLTGTPNIQATSSPNCNALSLPANPIAPTTPNKL